MLVCVIASRRLGPWLAASSLLAVLLAGPDRAMAQAIGAISGSVSDVAGMALVGAEVAVQGTQLRAVTDERGTFRLAGVPTGALVIRARRLGFQPGSLDAYVSPTGTASIAFKLRYLAHTLATVVIRPERLDYTGRLAGYYERLARRTGGYFITQDQIDRENPRMMTHLLQRIPGVSIARGRAGLVGVRMRGRACWPLVWFDGVPMPAGEVDLDSFAPHTIHGIELYLGSTTPPMRYTPPRDFSGCGTILLWSRGHDTDPPPVRSHASQHVEGLVSSKAVYTSEEVDVRAQRDSTHPLEVEYPPSLFAAGVRGLVVAEFVVDTLGHVEGGTIGVVSSTHPMFSEAVRRAVGTARYTPATRQGRPVRQVVHQPFTFQAVQTRVSR